MSKSNRAPQNTGLNGAETEPFASWSRKDSLALSAWILLSTLFFLIYIQFPMTPNFDEAHYLPAARQWLAGRQEINFEHPPLAKVLMAVGMALGGDRPFGWRLMSTLMGGLTIGGMFALGRSLFRSSQIASWIAALTLLNQLVYVQARIGMLDTFMCAGVIWGLVFFARSFEVQRPSREWIRAGLCFGAASACKWFGVVGLLGCGSVVLLLWLLRSWGVVFSAEKSLSSDPAPSISDSPFYSAELWREALHLKSLWRAAGLTGGAFLLIYFVSFFPHFFFKSPPMSLLEWIPHQIKMYEAQLRVVTEHRYMSTLSQWVFLTKAIWYAYDAVPGGQGLVRGVILIGNPWIMWTGLIAIVDCLWSWIVTRDRAAFLIASFYLMLTLTWAVIPRKIAFYYYYYPAGCILSLALAFSLFSPHSRLRFLLWKGLSKSRRRLKGSRSGPRANAFQFQSESRWNLSQWAFLTIAAAFFFYFLPILSGMKIQSAELSKWMWFRNWI